MREKSGVALWQLICRSRAFFRWT